MNINGDMDYPARVYVDYTLPSGQIDRTNAMIANDANELAQIKQERLLQAKSTLDRLSININNVNWPVIVVNMAPYG